MTLDTFQWRSSSTYDFVDSLVAPDLAWEWLRRNADYQRDYAEMEHPAADAQRLTDLVRRKWGLQFPCAPRFQRYRNNDLLGSRGRSRHRHSHRTSAALGLGEHCTA